MNWLEFVSTLWWPLVVALALILFAKPIRGFIGERLSSLELEAGPAKIKLSGEVQAAADKALESASESVQDSNPAAVTEATGGTRDFYERMMTLSYTSPAAAITESYKELEAEILTALQSQGVVIPDGVAGHRLLAELEKSRMIPQSEFILLNEARLLRNRAAHVRETLPVGVAADYVELVRQLIISLRLMQGRFEPT